MPRGDGTGPLGKGPGTGRGSGRGQGRKISGVDAQLQGMGPGGYCVCAACGTKVAHQPGKPCTSMVCPKCKASMSRG